HRIKLSPSAAPTGKSVKTRNPSRLGSKNEYATRRFLVRIFNRNGPLPRDGCRQRDSKLRWPSPAAIPNAQPKRSFSPVAVPQQAATGEKLDSLLRVEQEDLFPPGFHVGDGLIDRLVARHGEDDLLVDHRPQESREAVRRPLHVDGLGDQSL